MSANGVSSKKTIAIFGAGAVGGTIAGWVVPHHSELYVVDLPKNVEALKSRGITTFVPTPGGEPAERQHTRVQAVTSLKDMPKPDYVLVCVKNYSLDGVCKMIREQVGDTVTVVGFQNGVENQAILPKHFKKSIFGIVAYNAWQETPGDPCVLGAQKRGPLVLGVLEGGPRAELTEITAILNQGVPTVATDRLGDASHSKMIINLTNSLTTLVGHGFREISDPAIFQKLLTNLTAEGVEIVRANGHHECRMDGMPSWLIMRAAAKLPRFITKPIFNKNLKKMVVSSMAQDILQRGSTDSELESLNGYFIQLADRGGVKAPYNRAVYELCRERFSQPGFQPMDVREVWARVQTKLA